MALLDGEMDEYMSDILRLIVNNAVANMMRINGIYLSM